MERFRFNSWINNYIKWYILLYCRKTYNRKFKNNTKVRFIRNNNLTNHIQLFVFCWCIKKLQWYYSFIFISILSNWNRFRLRFVCTYNYHYSINLIHIFIYIEYFIISNNWSMILFSFLSEIIFLYFISLSLVYSTFYFINV